MNTLSDIGALSPGRCSAQPVVYLTHTEALRRGHNAPTTEIVTRTRRCQLLLFLRGKRLNVVRCWRSREHRGFGAVCLLCLGR